MRKFSFLTVLIKYDGENGGYKKSSHDGNVEFQEVANYVIKISGFIHTPPTGSSKKVCAILTGI